MQYQLNNIISICRGDSFAFSLTIADESTIDGLYRLQDDDAVYFGLMDPNQPFEEAVVKKKITLDSDGVDEAGNITIVLEPEDTVDLLPGRYFYTVKLKMDHLDADGNEVYGVKTIINRVKCVIFN